MRDNPDEEEHYGRVSVTINTSGTLLLVGAVGFALALAVLAGVLVWDARHSIIEDTQWYFGKAAKLRAQEEADE